MVSVWNVNSKVNTIINVFYLLNTLFTIISGKYDNIVVLIFIIPIFEC